MDTEWIPNGVPEDAVFSHYDDVAMGTVRLASIAASRDTGARTFLTDPITTFIDDMDPVSGDVSVEMPVEQVDVLKRVRLAASMIASRSRVSSDMLGYPPCIIIAHDDDNKDHDEVANVIKGRAHGNRSFQTVIIMTQTGCVALFPAYPGTSDPNPESGNVTYVSARAVVGDAGEDPGVLKLRSVVAGALGLTRGMDVDLDSAHTAMWYRDGESDESLTMKAPTEMPTRNLNMDPRDRGTDMISQTDTFVFADRMSRMQRTSANLQRALVSNAKDAIAFEMFMTVGVLGAASSSAPFNPIVIAYPVSIQKEKMRMLFKKMAAPVPVMEDTKTFPLLGTKAPRDDDDDDPDVITLPLVA